jgi:chromosome segregation ATPase
MKSKNVGKSMDKTKVDDMLIEMISPKIKEIEEKFSQGKGLDQDDINTLLLKSQYNHINHLDNKLNEVTQSVVGLEGKFIGLEGKFVTLEGKFVTLEGKFETFKAEMREDFEKRMGQLETNFSKLETNIQKSINDTMKWYIGGAGVILILLKALDIFIK